MLLRLAAALGICLALSLPSLGARAQDEKLDRPAIEGIIRDYLMTNPEVLEDALNALQDKRMAEQAARQKQALAENQSQLVDAGSSVILGNPDGDVTLIEFFDYNCGYCKRGLADVLKLLETDGKLRFVLKDFPVLGPGSLEAATVAVAVKEQLKGDKFLAFHRELLSTRGPVGKDRALEVARKAGVDMEKLDAAIGGSAVRSTLTQTLRLGDALGISGTPTYVLGGELVVGAVGYDSLREKIESVRRCGQATC